jgi:F-type H+-transporting ATPase subunit gamma
MPGTKEIKRRIKSVKSTKKITKAMELVAASKMKRAVSSTLASRLYAEYSSEILKSIGENIESKKELGTHPFFKEQAEGEVLVVLITSNRGLCGGYDSQMIKKTIQKLVELGEKGDKVNIITVGKKGDLAMRRVNQNITEVFNEMPDVNLRLSDIAPISKLVMSEYGHKYKKVFMAYTHFTSALVQRPIIKQLVPISKEEMNEVGVALGSPAGGSQA